MNLSTKDQNLFKKFNNKKRKNERTKLFFYRVKFNFN